MPLRHETLVAWQRADDLFVKVHQLTLHRFPAFEKYELGSQTRRAAFSVPANIAEGFLIRTTRLLPLGEVGALLIPLSFSG